MSHLSGTFSAYSHNDNTEMNSANLQEVRPQFECIVRRARARDAATLRFDGALSAAIACSPEELKAAAALVDARYGGRGYRVSAEDGERHPGITLIATEGDTIIGTLTVRLDGPQGLSADENYGDAIDAARRSGRGVCEMTRLAVDPSADSRSVLAALFGLGYVVCRRLHGADDIFVEVNPRHAVFYRRLFGFVTAAGKSICPRVMAPAVLLRLELERFEVMLSELGSLTASFLGSPAPQALAA
jgi:hypothetical protein